MYIALAILAFGIIIAIHELGHCISAKVLNVKVNEFAIGMGPKLISLVGKELTILGKKIEIKSFGFLPKDGPETLYSLRALPFGGFCAMEGEHEEDENPDPRSFLSQRRWKRIVILVAGSAANFFAAFIIVFVLTIGAEGFMSTTLAEVVDRFPEEGISELRAGDRVIALNGERLFYYDDFVLFSHLNADKPITFTIDRNGQIFEYQRQPYIRDGEEQYRYSIYFAVTKGNLWETLKYSGYQTYSFVRMIRVSIAMMISGAASLQDVSGPVGIVSAMNTIGQQAPTTSAALGSIVFFMAFIGVNVAVINLLPIPAMDGGRILFVILTWIIEKITRRHLDPKYEGYINTGAFVLLIGLMVVILYNDVMKIISG